MKSNHEIKSTARAKLSGQYLAAAGIMVVCSLLLGALSFTVIGSILFAGVLNFGLTLFFIRIIRKEKASFGDLFGGFSRFGTTCVAGILVPLFIALWSLLLVIPGIIKSYSYSMTYYILEENENMTATEAITESRRMMDGYKMKLFTLDLSFIGWLLLSVLTFGILYIFKVGPEMQAARAQFYKELRKNMNPTVY